MRLLRALLITALFVTSLVSRATDIVPVRSVALVPAADPIEYTLTSRTAAALIFPIASAGVWADSREKTRAFTALTMGFFSDMGTMGFAPKVNVDAHSFLRSGAENPFSTTIYYGVDARPPNKDWAIMAPDTARIPSFEVLMGEPERVDAVYRDALNLLAKRVAAQFMVSSPLKTVAVP